MSDEYSEFEVRVKDFHLDLYLHVNNHKYIEFLEEGRWNHFQGKFEPFQERGLAFVLVNLNINFRYQATVGDWLSVRTSLKKIGTTSAVMDQQILLRDSGKTVVDAEVSYVLFDRNTRQPAEITAEIKKAIL